VIIVDIAQIFNNVQTFITTNPLLLEEHTKIWKYCVGKYTTLAISIIMNNICG
jgi:hypothetical protein